jgi:hypothetical protein
MRAIIVAAVGAIAALATVTPAEAAPAGIVAAYAFDEGRGTLVRDSSVHAARGRSVGPVRVDGRAGGALRFAGRPSESVVIPSSRALRLRRGITVQAWVRPQGAGWRPVAARRSAGGAAWVLYSGTAAGGPVFQATVGGRRVRTPVGVPRLRGAWVNLAATYDGARLRVYRDGVLVSSRRASGRLAAGPGPLRIGSAAARGPRYRGLIDEIRVYGRALTPRELTSEMDRTVVTSEPPAAPPPSPASGPAAGPGTSGGTTRPGTGGTTRPPTGGGTGGGTTRPVVPSGLQFGVVGTRDMTTIDSVRQKAGAGITRIAFQLGTPVSQLRPYVARAAQNRIRPILLAEFPGDRAPPTAAQARTLAEWARDLGPGGTFWAGRTDGAYAPRYIEFGNETSYSYQGFTDRGGEYALRVRDAHGAIQAANPRVGLIVQADDPGIRDATWVNGMFDAVPNLASMVTMWSVHPYGPRSRWEPRLQALITQTQARGAPSSIPIAITEWGIATDNGRPLSDNYEWPVDMTYAQAGNALTDAVQQMTARFPNRIGVFTYYYSFDHSAPGTSSAREDYFGVFTNTFGDKGGLTAAVRALAARYPGQ